MQQSGLKKDLSDVWTEHLIKVDGESFLVVVEINPKIPQIPNDVQQRKPQLRGLKRSERFHFFFLQIFI